ncbi:MAG: hypothetical protein Q4A17_12745 [Thermoguttaceae bacterium]|nr:hypothetical protein [Thermoguttaceae bacterium]
MNQNEYNERREKYQKTENRGLFQQTIYDLLQARVYGRNGREALCAGF